MLSSVASESVADCHFMRFLLCEQIRREHFYQPTMWTRRVSKWFFPAKSPGCVGRELNTLVRRGALARCQFREQETTS